MDMQFQADDYWVFGFGSLMWRPGFDFEETSVADLFGFRSDMCFLSVHYRGTPEAPGLVCGLVEANDASAFCRGRAFKIRKESVSQVEAYLDKRELITDIYVPSAVTIRLVDGRSVTARTYLSDASHEQYIGHWSVGEKAEAIATGVGSEGASLEYLENLLSHLSELMIHDEHLSELLKQAVNRQ